MQMLISPRELRVLLVLAEELHFGRAAVRLGMAQPQLSSTVKRIETVLNLQLFLRRPKVSLTIAGSVLLQAVRRATRDLDSALAEAREVAAGRQGGVHIGFSDAAMLTDLPRRLAEFTRSNPDLRLRLTEGHSRHLLEQLQRGECDLIITRQQAHDPELTSVKLIPDAIILAAPEGHRLSGRGPVRLAELRDESVIMFSRSAAPAYHDRIIEACRAGGLEPRIAVEVDTRAATLALVAADFGVTFSTTASQQVGHPGVAFCEIAEPMPDVSFWVSHRVELPPAAKRLVKTLQSYDELPR